MTPLTAAEPAGTLTYALTQLRDRVAGLHLGLVTPESANASRTAKALVEQVDDYLLPRLASLDAPLLAVVGGSTGAGKSTLVNSLVQADVSVAGVLRPTTRAPVLVCAEADRAWFSGERVLPGLVRITGKEAGPGGLRLVALPALAAGLALIDAPDVDSVVATNRDLASQLLAAADLWLFCTTAARYADAVPWDLLRTAQERATALAVVLDRVPSEAVDEVAADLRSMLDTAGLLAAPLFVVQERRLAAGLLPEDQVAPIRGWLHELAIDREARARVVRQTLDGALASLDGRVGALVTAVERQEDAVRGLRDAAQASYALGVQQVDENVRAGSLLRGEVLTRWQDFVGTGEWMRGIESRIGRLRDRLTAAVRGAPPPGRELQGALESSVETLLRSAAEQAAERTSMAWRAMPGGPELLTGRERELDRCSAGFAKRAAEQVREWQGFVLALVSEQGADKRATARLLSFGVNGAGLAVMVALFAQTGGLTGGEIAVAGGTSAVGQRLLEAVFGDSAVRGLAARAREDLRERAERLLGAERERYEGLLVSAAPGGDDGKQLRAAVAGLRTAR